MECPIQELTYGELGARLISAAPDGRFPLWGSIEVTERCNLRCLPCYIRQPLGDLQSLERELSTTELENLLDQIADAGCICLLFTGGEPFAREDFLEIYTYAKRKGLIITIFTNATMLNPAIADQLAGLPPRTVEVTLYGRSQRVYEEVTGVPGSYARCMKGIELLMNRDVPLSLKAIVISTNQHELWEMKAFAGELGLDFRFDPVVNPRLDGNRGPVRFRIPPEDVVALDRLDTDRWNGIKQFTRQFFGPPARPEALYNCAAGHYSFHVDPSGRLSVCLMDREPSYDLRSGSFREAWQEFIPRVLLQRRRRQTPCQTCNLQDLCHQCAGWARLETGDAETPVEYLCRLTHLRAEALGLDIGGKERSRDQSHRDDPGKEAI